MCINGSHTYEIDKMMLYIRMKQIVFAKNAMIIFKRKYVRIDTKVLLGLMIKLNVQPKNANGKKYGKQK